MITEQYLEQLEEEWGHAAKQSFTPYQDWSYVSSGKAIIRLTKEVRILRKALELSVDDWKDIAGGH